MRMIREYARGDAHVRERKMRNKNRWRQNEKKEGKRTRKSLSVKFSYLKSKQFSGTQSKVGETGQVTYRDAMCVNM